jgi:hypothetical protein
MANTKEVAVVVRYIGGKLNGKIKDIPEPLPKKQEHYDPDTGKVEVYFLEVKNFEPTYVYDHSR